MPSTQTSDHPTPLTRADLNLWKLDLQRDLQQQFRADIAASLRSYGVRSQTRADLEEVLTRYDVRSQTRADVEEVLTRYDIRKMLRADVREEMEALFGRRDHKRSERLFVVYMALMGIAAVATTTALIVRAALGA